MRKLTNSKISKFCEYLENNCQNRMRFGFYVGFTYPNHVSNLKQFRKLRDNLFSFINLNIMFKISKKSNNLPSWVNYLFFRGVIHVRLG